MNDLVFRINYVRNNNKLREFERMEKEKNESLTEYTNNCRNLIEENKIRSNEEINELNKKVKELENNNKQILSEKVYYQESLKKIPKFILKICGIKNTKLLLETKE